MAPEEKPESAWAGRVANYLEVVEARLLDEKNLEGTMTTFNGFRFGDDNPYTELEAKRVLRLAMAELRKRRDLREELDLDPEHLSRGGPSRVARRATMYGIFSPSFAPKARTTPRIRT